MTESQNTVYNYLLKRILDLPSASPCLIAISGKDASGKTTMADLLVNYIQEKTDRQVIRISVDDFMNERSVRYTPAASAGEGCYKYTFNFESLKSIFCNMGIMLGFAAAIYAITFVIGRLKRKE